MEVSYVSAIVTKRVVDETNSQSRFNWYYSSTLYSWNFYVEKGDSMRKRHIWYYRVHYLVHDQGLSLSDCLTRASSKQRLTITYPPARERWHLPWFNGCTRPSYTWHSCRITWMVRWHFTFDNRCKGKQTACHRGVCMLFYSLLR